MLTFGAKGFVLESANMTDDDDEMRVEGLGRGSSLIARAPIWDQLGQDTEHRPLPGAAAFRVPPFHLASSIVMARARFLLWLSSLFLFFQLASSHLIEIPASKKECFFEDLHVNDQVHSVAPSASVKATHLVLEMTVTYQVGGGGHLDIDFWVK